jgi:hypothetical protein
LDITHGLFLIKKTLDVSETGFRLRRQVKGHLFWLAQWIVLVPIFGVLLPDDGDKLQSPKRRVFLIKDIQWIKSKKFVVLTKHHRHKPSEIFLNKT